MQFIDQAKNIFFIGIWLLIIGVGLFWGIFIIKYKHVQLDNGLGWSRILSAIGGTQTYTDYYGWKAVTIGIIFIITALGVLIIPFHGAIINYFKPGFVDSQGVKHILVKPGDFCGMKLDGGAVATCPKGYFCGPREFLLKERIGVCINS